MDTRELEIVKDRLEDAAEWIDARLKDIRRLAVEDGIVADGHTVIQKAGNSYIADVEKLLARVLGADSVEIVARVKEGEETREQPIDLFVKAGKWSLGGVAKLLGVSDKDLKELAGDAIGQGKGHPEFRRLKRKAKE